MVLDQNDAAHSDVATNTAMQLKLFGGFQLFDRRARKVCVALKRARALLAYLALRPTRADGREAIVDLLWPDRFKRQAQASLRQVLFELRKISAADSPIVMASRSEVAIGPGIEICDVWAFEDTATSDALADIDELLRLYDGPFLDGPSLGAEPFEQWAAIQRTRLEGQLEAAVLRVATGRSGDDDGERVSRQLDKLIRLSPMCCQAVLRLMEIAAANGRIADALRHYERYAKRLKLEFGDDPPSELSDAYGMLKSAPAKPVRFRRPRRRPAFSQSDPWRRTGIDAPVVAVLPFRYEGSRPSGKALASALGEDVTMMLSGCRWFSVLSRSATHSLPLDAPFIPSDFARRTGANYLIYGRVADRADAWSVAVELADAESGYIDWAKRFDATGKDVLSWGGEICPMIVAALDPAVAESEHRSLRRPVVAATASEIAYQHLVAGYRHFYNGAWAEAFAEFRSATLEDATYAHAHAMLALTTYYAAQIRRGAGWHKALKGAERSARRALEIDPSEPKACNILGQVLDWQSRHDESPAYLTQAVRLNPSFAAASTARSYHAVMTGAFIDAKAHIQTAMRLRVGDAGLGLCLPAKALAELHLGNTKDALQTAHWAARLKPDFWLTRQVLAACLWASDELDEARDTVAKLQEDYRGIAGDEFAAWFPYAGQVADNPIRNALTGAGWH